ncbi:juvenile hormone acid O-methyltransferase-like [Nylanderia fulva]|uniref:juvenile hormone acid O-methyltransferase-like n=1 Tax=Nylanderia fulva TaxID=613905 RepID=UPI0010FB3A0E|nr:juvenile hormone acid O-methyltransferase-like [Nylanderia fulva]
MNQVTSDSLLSIEKEYRCYNDIHKRLASYVIDEYDENLKLMSGSCIDIDCGLGDVTNNILLPALGPKATVIGTDKSNRAINYAKETYVNQARLKFEILNIETKNLPKKYISKFDHIFLFKALDWSMDYKYIIIN